MPLRGQKQILGLHEVTQHSGLGSTCQKWFQLGCICWAKRNAQGASEVKTWPSGPLWRGREGIRASGVLCEWSRCRFWCVVSDLQGFLWPPTETDGSLFTWGNLSRTLPQHSSSLFFLPVCSDFDPLSTFRCHSEFVVNGNLRTMGLATLF